MSDSEPSSPAPYGTLDDPGRDPKGLTPPRNLFGGGPDQDSGSGDPKASPGTDGESPMPESQTEDDDRA